MKKIFTVLVMLMVTVTAVAQTPDEGGEDRIKDLISDSFQDFFSDFQPGSLEKHFTKDFLLLETGEVWDVEMMRNYMDRAREQNRQTKRVNSFEFIEIKIEGKMAWVAYYNKAVFKKGEEIVREMNWLESATAILTEEGWKLQMLHSTIRKEE